MMKYIKYTFLGLLAYTWSPYPVTVHNAGGVVGTCEFADRDAFIDTVTPPYRNALQEELTRIYEEATRRTIPQGYHVVMPEEPDIGDESATVVLVPNQTEVRLVQGEYCNTVNIYLSNGWAINVFLAHNQLPPFLESHMTLSSFFSQCPDFLNADIRVTVDDNVQHILPQYYSRAAIEYLNENADKIPNDVPEEILNFLLAPYSRSLHALTPAESRDADLLMLTTNNTPDFQAHWLKWLGVYLGVFAKDKYDISTQEELQQTIDQMLAQLREYIEAQPEEQLTS